MSGSPPTAGSHLFFRLDNTPENRELFQQQIIRHRFHDKWSATIPPYDPDRENAEHDLLYTTEDGMNGIAIDSNGRVLTMYAEPDGHAGDALCALAYREGAHDALAYDIDGIMPDMWKRHGFHETGRRAWDDRRTPYGWSTAWLGEPDLVCLSTDD